MSSCQTLEISFYTDLASVLIVFFLCPFLRCINATTYNYTFTIAGCSEYVSASLQVDVEILCWADEKQFCYTVNT